MIPILVISLLLATTISHPKDKREGIVHVLSDLKGKIEVNIYAGHSIKSSRLGVFVCEHLENGQTNYSVKVRNLKEDNLVEFAYEKMGLPICDIYGDWVKVHFGFDHSGKILIGWIKHRKEVTNYFLWRDYLKTKMLFFESADQINFYDKPKGVKQEFKLEPSKYLKYDYIMEPLDTQNTWMKVKVTTPSDYCDTPENRITKIFWIQYLDKTSRPLVWFFTRGC